MRITSNPTRCILFFGVKIGENEYRAELDHEILHDEIKVKVFSDKNVEVNDEKLIHIIKNYIIQKYDISYEQSKLVPPTNPGFDPVRLDPPI